MHKSLYVWLAVWLGVWLGAFGIASSYRSAGLYLFFRGH